MKGFQRPTQSKLPVFLALSVGMFGVMTIAIGFAALKKGNQTVAQEQKQDKVVVVEKEAPVELVDVLVPVADIEQGKKLEPPMFRFEKRPKLALSQTSIRSFEEIKSQYARSIIPANQVMAREFMTTIRPANPVIANIPAGFRAVTISVNATSAVEGWATAGAMVDIQWIADVSGKRTATIIVENAKILSAERQTEGAQQQQGQGQPIPTTVTLLVTERDAQKITLASTGGSIVLHLRGANDAGKGSATEGSLTLQDLANGGRDDGLEGYVKIQNPDGTYREIKIQDGKMVQE